MVPQRRGRWLSRALVALVAAALAIPAGAPSAPVAASSQIRPFTPRFETTDRGSIALIGNTLMTCQSSNPMCASARNGTAGGTNNNNNSYTSEYVDVDGDATTFDSSSADLSLPAGADVLFAGLYWGADSASASRDQVRFSVPGGTYQSITADQLDVTGTDYAAVADVTGLLAALPSPNGTYHVANVQGTIGTDQEAGWTLVVAYRDLVTPAPLRNLTVFDGYLVVNTSNPSTITVPVSGFLTPATGVVNAEVGLVSFEGDLGYTGDQFRLNGNNVSDAANPLGNSFNSSISRLGTTVTAKNPNYLNQLGLDVDLLNGTGLIPNSATSANLTFTTSQETYYPTALTFAVDVFQPKLIATKAQSDVNGGVLAIGDEIQYTIDVTNLGNDPATNVVMTDPLPAGTSYVAGSASILSGANAGPFSDAAGDDVGEFDAANDRLVVRLGTGATSASGGQLDPGAATSVRLRVRVNTGVAPGTRIDNQAHLTYRGLTLGGSFTGDSDSDDGSPGDQPTDMTLDSAPVARDDAATTPEAAAVTVDVLANDTDVDGNLDPTSVTVTAGPAHGAAAVNPANGRITYTPDPDWHGTDHVTYQVCDSVGVCATATVTITVTSVNDPPTAVADGAVTVADTPVTVDVLANDTDVDGNLDPTSVTVASGPAHGTVSVNPVDGRITYTPDPGYVGPDTFTYRVCDSVGACATATVSVDVGPGNSAPVARDDAASTSEDTAVTVDVLANDTDVDGNLDPTSVTVTAGPAHGAVTVNPANGRITYTPDPDWHGTDHVTYQVCDTDAACATATVTLDVTSVNDPPVARDDAATTSEDTAVTVDVLANDTDVDGNLDPTSVTVTAGPAHGAAAVNPANGRITYTPDPDWHGTDHVTYQVCDSVGVCATATLDVVVVAVPDAPRPRDDAATTPEDTAVTVDVLANDTDPDGNLDPTSVTVTSGPSHGTASVDPATGAVTYTPDPDWNGSDSFTYQVCDTDGLCATASADITVQPMPDPPVARDDAATTPEDTAVTADVLANDTDVDGDLDSTSVTVTSGPAHGTAAVDPANGRITYTPDPDWNGSDSLTYQVCDGSAPPACATATLAVTVTSVNDPPVARDDAATTPEDTAVTVDVLANDTDVDGNLDPTSVTVTAGPTHGAVTVNPTNGRITYTPDPDWNGTDHVTYQVCDTAAPPACAWAAVDLDVSAVADPPVARADAATTPEDTPVVVDVLANDSDPDGNLDPTSVTVTAGPGHGTVTVDPTTGAVTYTPNPDWNGSDSFTYQVCDTLNACASAAASVTVGPVNDPPVAADDAATTPEDTAVTVDVLANDHDVDGSPVPGSVAVTSGPTHGTASVNPATGRITYTPDADWHGSDSLTYEVCDDAGACATATVTLDVTPVADPPVARDDAATTPEDTAVTVDVLANDSDVDGDLDATSVLVRSGPAHGSVQVDHATGAIAYVPDRDWNGTDHLTYRVCDRSPSCVTATVTVTVTPVPDPPNARADRAVTELDHSVVVHVLANDDDPDGDLDPTSVTVTTGPAHGTIAVDPATGAVTYTPDTDWNGVDVFSYRVCDLTARCAVARVVVAVSVPGTFTFFGPGDSPISVPLGIPLVVIVLVALGIAVAIDRRRATRRRGGSAREERPLD